MYVPESFRESDRALAFDLIDAHGFATLVSWSAGAPVVSHVPLILDRAVAGQERLLGHVARANEHWRRFDGEEPALAIFHGPHAYVSPSWYSNHPSVPTWNYAVVHVHGTPQVLDSERTWAILRRLIETSVSVFRVVLAVRRRAARMIVAGWAVALVMSGCHRLYEIHGTVQVVPAAVRRAALPAILCSGPGGALENSGVHAHPTWRPREGDAYGMATIFCSAPPAGDTFPLRESIYYGSLPKKAHVYAWLESIPAARAICLEAKQATLAIDGATLYRLRLGTQAQTHRSDPSWPCGARPSAESPMAFAVTFDPDHKTWEEHEGGVWIERRAIRVE